MLTVLEDAKLPTDPVRLKEAVAEVQAAQETLKNSDPGRITQLLAENKRLQQAIRNKDNQTAHLRERLKGPGGGTEHPPCWATPEGKEEYIFDVAVATDGYIIRERNLPHREEEKQDLPLQGITFGTRISNQQFLRETAPLFEWSRAHDCWFFVLAYDLTGPGDKAIYKKQLWTLEKHFYKWEVREDTF